MPAGFFVDGVWYHLSQFERDKSGAVRVGLDGKPTLKKGAVPGKAGKPGQAVPAEPNVVAVGDADVPASKPVVEPPSQSYGTKERKASDKA